MNRCQDPQGLQVHRDPQGLGFRVNLVHQDPQGNPFRDPQVPQEGPYGVCLVSRDPQGLQVHRDPQGLLLRVHQGNVDLLVPQVNPFRVNQGNQVHREYLGNQGLQVHREYQGNLFRVNQVNGVPGVSGVLGAFLVHRGNLVLVALTDST